MHPLDSHNALTRHPLAIFWMLHSLEDESFSMTKPFLSLERRQMDNKMRFALQSRYSPKVKPEGQKAVYVCYAKKKVLAYNLGLDKIAPVL